MSLLLLLLACLLLVGCVLGNYRRKRTELELERSEIVQEQVTAARDQIQKHADAYAFIEPVKSRLFPETFEYVHKGLDGTDATTTHVLFGDLVAAVEETIDQDADDESARVKGFKPGTNAQRHRFYRHGSSDVSSRFAGLTSMVRESFRASLRRVNVASETDSEKASPAAAQPAARPQLSWRASAPEYGTFES